MGSGDDLTRRLVYTYITTGSRDHCEVIDKSGRVQRAVQRTQIYLTDAQARALDRIGAATGQSRSELIRRAIDDRYVGGLDRGGLKRAFREACGLWRDRDPAR